MRPAEVASGEDVRACRYAAYRTRHATIDAASKPGGSIGTSMVGRLRGKFCADCRRCQCDAVKKFSTGSVGGTLTVIASEANQSIARRLLPAVLFALFRQPLHRRHL